MTDISPTLAPRIICVSFFEDEESFKELRWETTKKRNIEGKLKLSDEKKNNNKKER